jgi:hypothetical protein
MAVQKETDTIVKKRSDAYTGFLAISFLAMVGATVLLYLEYQNYEGKAAPKAPAVDVPGAQLKQLPGSGAAPKVEKPPDMGPGPMDAPKDMKDMKDMPMMMRKAPVEKPRDTVPVVLPPVPELTEEPVVLPPPAEVKVAEPIIDIDGPVTPAKADEFKPIIPAVVPPSSDDPPPLKNRRFNPSK